MAEQTVNTQGKAHILYGPIREPRNKELKNHWALDVHERAAKAIASNKRMKKEGADG